MAKLCPAIQNIKLVPPLYHALAKIRLYVFETVQDATGVSRKKLFDALNVEVGPTFHGHPYESGEARVGVSWAEVTLGKSTNLRLAKTVSIFGIMHDLQMSIYCK
jgi:hypothetical protein